MERGLFKRKLSKDIERIAQDARGGCSSQRKISEEEMQRLFCLLGLKGLNLLYIEKDRLNTGEDSR